jgi:hypothetical protein
VKAILNDYVAFTSLCSNCGDVVRCIGNARGLPFGGQFAVRTGLEGALPVLSMKSKAAWSRMTGWRRIKQVMLSAGIHGA